LAAGNIVQAVTIKGSDYEAKNLMDLCNASFGCLKYDKNEKIVSSAIRTIAKILYCYYSADIPPNSKLASLREKMFKILECVITLFSDKIKVAIDLCQGHLVGLSWKSRSTLNKHAWGSCYSLSHIFKVVLAEKVSVLAVDRILQCVRSYRAINIKVCVSATMVLQTLPEHFWSTSSFIDIKCKGLLTCVCILSDIRPYQKLPNISFKDDVKVLFMKLLRISNLSDIKMLLLKDEFNNKHLQWCYLFLSQTDVNRSLLRIFALSLHECMLERDFDVSLLQMFKSRSIQKERNASKFCPNSEIVDDEL